MFLIWADFKAILNDCFALGFIHIDLNWERCIWWHIHTLLGESAENLISALLNSKWEEENELFSFPLLHNSLSLASSTPACLPVWLPASSLVVFPSPPTLSIAKLFFFLIPFFGSSLLCLASFFKWWLVKWLNLILEFDWWCLGERIVFKLYLESILNTY